MIQTLDPRPYIVRPGDTLTSIARQAGFTNPLDIYNNPANATLRSHRNNPNLIRPGDRIMIPPTPQMVRQVLQARLDALVALRQQMDALFQKLEAEADQNISKYRKVASAADIAAMLASLGVSLGQLTYKGFSAMRLSGEALEKANAELAKDSLHFAYDPLRDPVLKVTADKLGAHPGTVTLVGKATIEAFLNIQSPSWWAGVWGNLRSGSNWSQAVTTDPIQTLVDSRNQIENQRQQTLKSLDLKIQQTRALLQSMGSGVPSQALGAPVVRL